MWRERRAGGLGGRAGGAGGVEGGVARRAARAAIACRAAAGAGGFRAGSSHYELLGVAPTSSATEIKSAFRRLALRLHPDVCSDPDATVRFTAVKEAYEVLSCERSRRDYDSRLSASPRARNSGGGGSGGGSTAGGWGAAYGGAAGFAGEWGAGGGGAAEPGRRRAGGYRRRGGGAGGGGGGGSSYTEWFQSDAQEWGGGGDADAYSAGGFYRWAESGSHQTSWQANSKKRRARAQQQQQQQQQTAQQGPQAAQQRAERARGGAATGPESNRSARRRARGSGGGGSGFAGGGGGGDSGGLEDLLSQLDEATLRGLRSVYGGRLQGLADAEELQEFLEQMEELRRGGARFEQFGAGAPGGARARRRQRRHAAGGGAAAGAGAGASTSASAGAAAGPSAAAAAAAAASFYGVDLSALGIQSEDELADVLELLGLDGMEDLLGSFPSASPGWRAARGGRPGVRGGGDNYEELWAWVDGEGSDDDGGGGSGSDDEWYREARDFYGEVG
ncbi:hypothetical protein Rsub_04815 [Raphidocelis subcapitata]|uniref:J domain-containing protein n=1 Tax=Raphidocelis subcapitata TaxID=307507 RepID=A0A2V0NU42_9CHLO|nr:hypothetical protein Rsub_04815 [Raphidocelis subcapitata]|eukprot:GBF91146.1 hypothetical protein Rsub_04815 [Raphidocelis subcapitata]